MNWDDTRIFLAIARYGTLTAAAQQLGLGVATISRRLERFENSMPMALFSRHQSGYHLTDEGMRLLPHAEDIERAALALHTAAQIHNQVEGLVRIAVPENLAYTLVLPTLQTLYQQHPKLRIELSTGVEIRNVHRRDVDLAIRTIQPEQGNVTIRRLGTLTFAFYATSHYLQHTAEQDYAYIGWAEQQQDLDLARFLTRFLKHKNCVLQCNSLLMQIHAVQQNLGIAILPTFIAQQHALQRVHASQRMQQSIWLVAQSHVLSSQRVRTVADHFIALFNGMTMLNEESLNEES